MKGYTKLLTALLSAIAFALLLAYFAGFFHAKLDDAERLPEQRVAGSAQAVAAMTAAVLEEVAGTVQSTSDTILASRIMATILRVNVKAGDSVTAEDVLIELDAQALQASRAQRAQEAEAARVLLEEAELNERRMRALRANGSVSIAALDQAVTAARRAAAELERATRAVAEADAALGYARIRAPMSGTVVEHYAEAGDMAAPGQPLVKLFNPGQMRIEATVRESLIGSIRLGEQLAVRIDALMHESTAVVEEIVPAADPSSRTFVLKARLDEVDGVFPGMFARLFVPLTPETKIWVPWAAVHQAGQVKFVYVRDAAGDRRRLVRLGDSLGERVEVRSGLDSDDRIVVP